MAATSETILKGKSMLTWEEVEEHGVDVARLHAGDRFVNVLSDYSTFNFEEVVGEVVSINVGSVTVRFVRSGRLETTTWAPEAKVIRI